MIGSSVGLFGMHYWQVYQGTLSVNTKSTELTNTHINKNADIDHTIEKRELKNCANFTNMFEDLEEHTKAITYRLKEQAFTQGIEKGRLEGKEEVAKNLLLQRLDISIIEKATGLSKENLVALQKSTKTDN